ncbi:hypothetical protein AD931_02375 [Gluconobacter oxydans]|uniref:Phage protein n=2 Tax=Gluconobacter oxydans TaxID=442 RepID=A0AB34XK24_GLUOY|nr:hypothetical protein [Gluconobacter oxydans]AHK72195.1 hypothetical protein GLS_c23240 [Gluconobacter oxydans DSM 3504]KXV10006.1 hypothetical protein AD931_02375 [Gluconobacter oxydans]
MAFADVTLPSVWDIPAAVGVPALLGQSIATGVDATASTALAGIAQNYLTAQAAKQWGIFGSGNTQLLTSGRVMGIEYENSYTVSDAPLEGGAFASYNKVKMSYSARVIMVCDGTETGSDGIISAITTLIPNLTGTTGNHVRSSFISTLEALVADTNLYSGVTPEFTATNANIIGYRWRRESSQGVTMLMAEIMIRQIRSTGTAAYTNTSQPQGAQTVQNGTVQTTTPSLPVQTSLLGVTL